MTGSAPAPRGAMAVVRDRVFGRYLAGKLISSIGIWAQNITAVIVMWDLTRSAFLVGAVSVTQFAGSLVLSPWTGALSDRFDRRRLLMLGRVISAGAAGSLATAAMLDVLSATALLAATTVLGVGMAITSPAMQALVTALLPRQDWEQGIALNSVLQNIARAVGPAIGSGLLLLGGPAAAFGFAAFGHAVFALSVVGMRVDATARGPRGRVLDGFRHLRTNRVMLLLILGVAALGFGADPIITLTPALADDLGRGDGAVGLMASTFGAGALVAASVMKRVRSRLSLRAVGTYGFYALGGGIALAGISPSFELALVPFAIAGAGFLTATTSLTTRIQLEVPDIVRGRVMAIWGIAFLGSRPLAAAFNGSVADLTDVTTAMAAAGTLTVVASRFARVRDSDDAS